MPNGSGGSLLNRLEKSSKDELREDNKNSNEKYIETIRKGSQKTESQKKKEQYMRELRQRESEIAKSFVMKFSNLWTIDPFVMSPIYTQTGVETENSIARLVIMSTCIMLIYLNFREDTPFFPSSFMNAWNSILGSNSIVIVIVVGIIMIYSYYRSGVYNSELEKMKSKVSKHNIDAQRKKDDENELPESHIYESTYQDPHTGHIFYNPHQRDPRPRPEMNVLNTHLGGSLFE